MKVFSPTQALPRGTTLIEASAGTGKTWTITGLVLRLLLEEGLGVQDILIVTFTEAATSELQDRVRSRIREAQEHLSGSEPTEDPLLEHLATVTAGDRPLALRRLRQALYDFDCAAISTIHGFCKRMLQENAFESGALFDTELVADQTELLQTIAYDFWATRMGSAHPALVRHAQTIGFGPARLLQLAERLAAEPDLGVLPDHSTLPPATDEALVSAFAALREGWRSGRADLERTLARQRQEGWKYRGDSLAKKLGGVDEWLTPTRPERSPPWQLESLRPDEIKQSMTVPEHPVLDAIEAFFKAWAANAGALDRHLVELQLEFRDHLVDVLPRRKAESRTWSFDDLLLELDQALQGERAERLAKAIRRRYQAALIDEFQDTDPVQYRIFRRVFRDGSGWLFLIGDPKQAIYGFRGADIHAYAEAKRDAGDRCFTLSVNYRSDPGLVSGLNALFGALHDPFAEDFIDYPPVSARPEAEDMLRDGVAPVVVRGYDDLALLGRRQKRGKRVYTRDIEGSLPRHVSADIARLLHSGVDLDGRPIAPGDIAVLVRTNKEAERTQASLRLRGIPSVLHGASSVLASHEANELELLMVGVSEPARTTGLRTALATDLLGLSAADIAGLDEPDSGAWDHWVERFRTWRALWERQSFARMFRSVLEDQGVQGRLLGAKDGERRMTNLLHVVEFVHTAAVDRQLGIAGLLRWYRAQRRDQTPNAELLSLRLESDAKAVQLITIHKAKGLEYPVVFAPYLWTSWMKTARTEPVLRFHHRGLDGRPRMLDLGSENKSEHLKWFNEEQKAENLRLQYVALTRAKHRVYLYLVPGNKSFDDSPLSFLLHQRGPSLPGQALADTRARVRELGIEDLMEDAQAHIDGLAETVEFQRASQRDDTAPPWGPSLAEEGELAARSPGRPPDGSWRTSSFSALKGDRPATAAGHLAEGRDHDTTTQDIVARAAGDPIDLGDFPRGAKAGNFFHDVLEHLDFQSEGDPDMVRRMLDSHGYDAEWLQPVLDFVGAVVDTPFHDDGLRLADLAGRHRLNEMQFVLPVRHGLRACDPRDRMTSSQLAAVFREHASPQVPSTYADQLAALGFEPLHGFLKGFIDLIFEREGRWWVVDYKSNHVGDTRGAYAEAALAEPMAHGHYILQYHLYLLALHRYLRARLADYDYDSHIGGSTYLFIKGMHPSLGATHGAFRDRPTRAMIEALDALLEAP